MPGLTEPGSPDVEKGTTGKWLPRVGPDGPKLDPPYLSQISQDTRNAEVMVLGQIEHIVKRLRDTADRVERIGQNIEKDVDLDKPVERSWTAITAVDRIQNEVLWMLPNLGLDTLTRRAETVFRAEMRDRRSS